ncbi:hypothetical protein KIW84_012415 [Lathyrus oleraceus]|uniref:PB1-like domain-containing protein n=1 Tax=Pisum sativum TaxID=3888 RepID=A0A9D5BHM6_PEA|nr:hypothetical protein KIW84_012415 [Pisum sativum]
MFFFSEGDNESSYGGSVVEVKCDVDKWSYFEVLGIVKELGYEESGTVIYKNPTIVSQPDYYDGPIEDETENIAKVVVNVDETEDVIGKLVEEVLNGKSDGVSDLNKAEVRGTNVDVNGVEDMSEGELLHLPANQEIDKNQEFIVVKV